jgi:hypothetical protein
MDTGKTLLRGLAIAKTPIDVLFRTILMTQHTCSVWMGLFFTSKRVGG